MAMGKIIATWSDDTSVAIYDHETWTVRLYEDRAVYHYPTVRWVGNSGSLAHTTDRITGDTHKALLKIAREQIEDDADYTDRVATEMYKYRNY